MLNLRVVFLATVLYWCRNAYLILCKRVFGFVSIYLLFHIHCVHILDTSFYCYNNGNNDLFIIVLLIICFIIIIIITGFVFVFLWRINKNV